jgi:hypothetical protein
MKSRLPNPFEPQFVSNIPKGGGAVVAMRVHHDRLYVATQRAVFVLNDADELEQLPNKGRK